MACYVALSINRCAPSVPATAYLHAGDGHGDTLAVAVNDAGTRTHLKYYAYDEGGNRFEVAFAGDIGQYLTEDRIIFASTSAAAPSDQVALSSVGNETAMIELLGMLPDNPSAIV